MNGQCVVSPSHGFEWWYLHVSSPKACFALAIHTTALLGGPICSPYISVTIVHPKSPVIYDQVRFDRSELIWRDGYLILVPYMVENRDGWELDLSQPGWSIAGTIRRESEGWRTKESQLIVGVGGREMHWAVPMPRGLWDGALTIGNKAVIDQPGYAYQDHNWADECLMSFVNGWAWHAAANEKTTVIWAQVGSLEHRIERLGIRVDRKGQITPICRPLRALLRHKITVKHREYEKDTAQASYERSVICGPWPRNRLLGFSERVEVMADVSADREAKEGAFTRRISASTAAYL